MTRDKERLAEEVIELTRVNGVVASKLAKANAEVLRVTGELRKRERALEALERGYNDGGAARRATRILELETENEIYFSEVTRLSSLLRLDRDTGRPETSATSEDEVVKNSSEAKSATSYELARLRAELAFGAKHAADHETPFDPAAEDALLLAEERAEIAEAKVSALERDILDARSVSEASASRAEASETRAVALAGALEKTKEDRDHFRKVAAMEAAAAEECAEEACLADAECKLVRRELDSLRRQIGETAEAVELARRRADDAEARERAISRAGEKAEGPSKNATSERKEAREKARESLKQAMAPPAGFVLREKKTHDSKPENEAPRATPRVSAATIQRRLSLKAAGNDGSARTTARPTRAKENAASGDETRAPRDSATALKIASSSAKDRESRGEGLKK
jgi:hypothetical protein